MKWPESLAARLVRALEALDDGDYLMVAGILEDLLAEIERAGGGT